MSDLPSPSKSPTPATLQLASVIVANTAPLESVAPFMSQIVFSPVVPLCHRMSDLPSPSKSPTPAMLQLMSSPPTGELSESVVPFMSHIAFWPVALLRHRMSDLPSALKSPTPAMLQLGSVIVAITAPPKSVLPFMSQIAFSPVARLCHRMSDLRSLLKSLPTRRLTSVFTETGAVHAELFPAASKALTR